MKPDSHKAWTKTHPPKKILAIRMHALGDTMAAISALQNLRNQLPKETIIDFIVKKEFSNIPKDLTTFNNVYTATGNTYKKQALSLVLTLCKIWFKRYDVVLDLQNNTLSNFIRKFINPKCYVEFDKYSKNHGYVRNINTINKAGIIQLKEQFGFDLINKSGGKIILNKHGIQSKDKVIVLNPAGAFLNRNWPIQNYVDLAKLFISEYGDTVKFLVIGTDKIKEKVIVLEKELKHQSINMINKTTQGEVLAIIQEIDLMISEDGALFHMAYLSNKPTIGLIGSTRSDWTVPKLPHTFSFTSDDMECGNCMLEICKYNTNECMTRVTPKMVYDKAKLFLK